MVTNERAIELGREWADAKDAQDYPQADGLKTRLWKGGWLPQRTEHGDYVKRVPAGNRYRV